jgi:hypothetical protein
LGGTGQYIQNMFYSKHMNITIYIIT